MLHTPPPREPRRIPTAHPTPTAQYEPSDEWKAEVRHRIRNEARQMQHHAIQNLRDNWLKRSRADDPDPYNHPDFERECRNIERQVQTWANDSYRSELEREINLSRFMAGENVQGDWQQILEEQEAILKQIEESRGPSSRAQPDGRVDSPEPEDSPTSPNLGLSAVSPPDKPSDAPLFPLERRDSTRRASPYASDDPYSPSVHAGSNRQRPPPLRRPPIPEFWTPPSEAEETILPKAPFRRGSNASVRSVGSQNSFRAPITTATIPERGPVHPDTYERERTSSNNTYPVPPAAGGPTAGSPAPIQLDPSAGRGERNRAGSASSNRNSFGSSSFPTERERINSFHERGGLGERAGPYSSTPPAAADGYPGSDNERAYFARSPSNSIPGTNRGPQPPPANVPDMDYERPASVQSVGIGGIGPGGGQGGYRLAPDRSPAPTFGPPPPPPYQHHISPLRDKPPMMHDRNLEPVAPEWRERKWSQATNYGPYPRPDSTVYARPDSTVYGRSESVVYPRSDSTIYTRPESTVYVRSDSTVYDYAPPVTVPVPPPMPPPPPQMPHDYLRRPTIDTRYVPPQSEYDPQPAYHPPTFYDDQPTYSPEEDHYSPARMESRMKFQPTGWVNKNGSDHLPPDLVRQFKAACSSHNMDNYESLPRQEQQLWLRIEQVAHNLTKQKEDLDLKKEEADRLRKEVEKDREEAKKREEALRQQEDQLKLREYQLLFREKEVEFNAKLREKEDELKFREAELNRRVQQVSIDREREKEQRLLEKKREEEDRVRERQREEELRQLTKEREEERRRAEDERKREMEESRQAKAALLQELQAQRERERQDEERRRVDAERRDEQKRYEEEERARKLQEDARAEARLKVEEEERERLRRKAEAEDRERKRRQAEAEDRERKRRQAEEEEKERQRLLEEERKRLAAEEEERERQRVAEEERQRLAAEEKERQKRADLERFEAKRREARRRLAEEERAKAQKLAEEEDQRKKLAEEEERRRKEAEEDERMRQEQAAAEARWKEVENRRRELAAEAERRKEQERKRQEEEKLRMEEEEKQRRREEAEKKKKQADEEEQRKRRLAEEEGLRKAEEEKRRRDKIKAAEAVAARLREEKARKAAAAEAQARQEGDSDAERLKKRDEEIARELDRKLREEEERVRAENERLRREEQQRRDEAKLEAELNRIHERAAARMNQEAQGNGDSQRKSEDSTYDPHERYRSGLYGTSSGSTPPRKPYQSASSSQPHAPDRSSSTSSWTGWESWGKAPSTNSSSSSYSQAGQRTTPQRNPSAPPNFSKPTTATPNPSNPQPAPSRTPLSSAEWARRQAEHAKKQQEQFLQEQERLERARQEKLSKSMSKEDMMQTFEWHERMWVRLAEAETLTWDSFPWPMLKKPTNPDEITPVGISAYVLNPLGPGREKPSKDRIKEQIRRWHPDRFETKLLPKVDPAQADQVKAGAGAVVRSLNELLTRTNSSASGGGLFG